MRECTVLNMASKVSRPSLIDACNKNTKLEKLKNAIRYSKEVGVKVHLTFTFGLPGETAETIRETMDFAKEVNPESAQFSICTPFPGTKFYHECKSKGYLVTDDWSRYLGSGEAVVETPWLTAKELETEFAKATAEWDEFRENRLRLRKEKLAKELLREIDFGKCWTLLGERNSASFLWHKEDRIANTFVEKNENHFDTENRQIVIVSEHDEEKIWRQLARQAPDKAKNILRLYS